jgi:single-stranded-DNA-specific exonuclease
MARMREPLSESLLTLLARRGIEDPDEQERFLHPDFERDTHHHSLLHDIDRAVSRIFAAMTHGEQIAIYGDFDCDGIPGTAILYETFAKIGYDKVQVYIPHRDREGYGVHADALKALASRGVSLIITVDVGTTAIEPVRYAKNLGMDVIVTDHHEVKDALPEAAALINPKLGEYPFRDLCGAAVAWKLASAVLAEGKRRGVSGFLAIPDGWEKWLLDLVAIATIADLVPLVGENRALAHFGITVLRKTPRPGIRALAAELRLRQSELTEDDISFSFAPRLNAASRMGDPEIAFGLLVARERDEAETLARQLEELNARRKGAVGAVVREAKKRMEARFRPDEPIVVMGDPAWKPSLLGLVANKLLDGRTGMVCLWGESGSGELKGSCRTDGSLSMVDIFTRAEGATLEFGGHHASGGFSLTKEQAHSLPDVLRRVAEEAERVEKNAAAEFDAHASLSQMSWSFYRELARLSPFGIGNPKPVFRIARTSVVSVRSFGKEKNHVEVMLTCPDTNASLRSFDFFRSDRDFTVQPVSGVGADVLATLERDAFRGWGRVVLRLVDILPAQE